MEFSTSSLQSFSKFTDFPIELRSTAAELTPTPEANLAHTWQFQEVSKRYELVRSTKVRIPRPKGGNEVI